MRRAEGIALAKPFAGTRLRRWIDASPLLRRLSSALEALVGLALAGLVALLPPDRASAFGRWLLRSLGPRIGKSAKFRRNLELAFPDASPPEIEALLREVWGATGAVGAEYPHLPAICGRERHARIETVVKCDVESYRSRARPAVFVGAHLANWEVGAAAAAGLGIPLAVVYSPPPNPRFERWLRRCRAPLGCEFLSRDSLREMVRWLEAGGSLGMLVDHRVDSGEPVPFFGLDKLTTILPARLALRYGADLVPGQVERVMGARFRVTLHAPIPLPKDRSDPGRAAREMMRQVNLRFEDWIRAQPGEWSCGSRLWPSDARRPASGRPTVGRAQRAAGERS